MMNPISSETFALVCYLVLMENDEGVLGKHPDYINEKVRLLDAGYNAFGALDIKNMRKVKEWCERWNMEMPEAPKNYLEQSEEASKNLSLEL